MDAELAEITDCLAEQLRECQGYSLGWLLKAGAYLLETRTELEFGEWTKMFASGRMPIGLRTAQTLIHIAENRALSDAKNLSKLPSSISALDELAALRSSLIDAGIADGVQTLWPRQRSFLVESFRREERQKCGSFAGVDVSLADAGWNRRE